MLAHNSASYIATAIESVRAQTFQDWELLISGRCFDRRNREKLSNPISKTRDSLCPPSGESQAGEQLDLRDRKYVGANTHDAPCR